MTRWHPDGWLHGDSGNTETDDTDTGALLIRGYDATDRMASIDDGAGTVFTYLHNVLGQRVAKAKTGGGTRHFLYGLSGSLTAEASGSTGANLVEYIWLDGAPLAYTKAGVVYRIHTDHLGTPRKLTHPDGTEAWSAVLRPFGGEDAVGGDVNFNLRFPGQYFDTEFDLHYNYHRNYDPNTGRYFESDPIGLQGGWNTYGYVGGNPVMRVDPNGLICIPYGTGWDRKWYCDGIFDWLQKDYPPIPRKCCNSQQLVACRALAAANAGIPCAVCLGAEPAGWPTCALCAAGVVEFIFVCREQNCAICEPPAQVECPRPTGSGGGGGYGF